MGKSEMQGVGRGSNPKSWGNHKKAEGHHKWKACARELADKCGDLGNKAHARLGHSDYMRCLWDAQTALNSMADRIEALEAERGTAIAAAYEVAADVARAIEANPVPSLWNFGTTPTKLDKAEWKGRQEAAQDIAAQVSALTPADAIAERDADRARVRREAWLECVDWIQPQRNDRPANGSEFAAAIRAKIEEESNG